MAEIFSKEPITFTVSYSVSDFIEAKLLLVKSKPGYRDKLIFASLLVSISLLMLCGFSFFIFLLNPSDFRVKDIVIASTLTIFIILYVIGAWFETQRIFLIRLQFRLQKNELKEPYEFIFSNDGIVVKAERNEQNQSIQSIVRRDWQYYDLVLVGKTQIIFVKRKKLALTIPIRVFQDSDEAGRFIDLVKQNLNFYTFNA